MRTTTPRLRNHTSQRHHHLSYKCHGDHRLQWRIVTLRSQITKHSSRTLLHDKWICRTPKQRSSDHNFTNHQDCNVICSWGRTVSTIYQLPQSRSSKNYAVRNGAQTAPNANENRQHNRSWRVQRQHCKQKVEVNGNDNQLSALQRSTETIPELLGAGTYKPRQLLDQAPCSHTPPHSTANTLDTKKLPRPTSTKTRSYVSGNSINNQMFLVTSSGTSAARVW